MYDGFTATGLILGVCTGLTQGPPKSVLSIRRPKHNSYNIYRDGAVGCRVLV